MLVLSRQRDETVMIGDEIELTIVDIRGDKVRLGIKAPPRVPVHRKEVYDAIRRENEQASAMNGGEIESIRPSRPRPGRAASVSVAVPAPKQPDGGGGPPLRQRESA